MELLALFLLVLVCVGAGKLTVWIEHQWKYRRQPGIKAVPYKAYKGSSGIGLVMIFLVGMIVMWVGELL